jgi:hypothetical protein
MEVRMFFHNNNITMLGMWVLMLGMVALGCLISHLISI